MSDLIFIVTVVFIVGVLFLLGWFLWDLALWYRQDLQRTKLFRENRRIVIGVNQAGRR